MLIATGISALHFENKDGKQFVLAASRHKTAAIAGFAQSSRARVFMASPKVSRRPSGDVLSYNVSLSSPCNATSRKGSESHKVRQRGKSLREPARFSKKCSRVSGHVRSSCSPRSAACSSLSQTSVKDCCPFSLKRPRTSWGKPHVSFVKLIDVLTNGTSSTMEAFPRTHDRELIESVPSSWSAGDHYDLCIPSDTSSSSEKPPACGQLPFPGILSDATFTVCSPPSCSQHDFSSDDMLSLVVSEDYCDVGSVLGPNPFSRKQDTCMTSLTGTEITPFTRATTTQVNTEIKEEFSEEDYSIDLSEFKPDDMYYEPDCTSDQNCLQGLRLRLDYQDVLNTWSDGGCLWADGKRPEKLQVEWLQLQLEREVWC